MDDLKEQQLEALEVVSGYIDKLVPSMKTMVEELQGARKEDTEEFLKQILNGLNWCIEVFNGTMSLVNADRVRIDKSVINAKILELSAALKSKDDQKTAEILGKNVIPFLTELKTAADEITAA